MKVVIFSGVIFILIVLLIIFSSVYTASKTKMMEEFLSELSQTISVSDWEKSGETYEVAYKKWKQSERTFALMFRHEELDNIDESIQKLGVYISLNDRDLALTEITLLEFNTLHLLEKDKIQVENLF